MNKISNTLFNMFDLKKKKKIEIGLIIFYRRIFRFDFLFSKV